MSEPLAETPILQTPLDAILCSELELGNEIAEIERGGWSKVDLVVSLKFPFRKDYQNQFEGIEFYRNRDTHYSLSDSYTSAINRESVEAPY